MDPMLAQRMLGSSFQESRSSIRNPDNFFPEREVPVPDPIGVWFMTRLAALGEWLAARRQVREAPAERLPEVLRQSCPPAVPRHEHLDQAA